MDRSLWHIHDRGCGRIPRRARPALRHLLWSARVRRLRLRHNRRQNDLGSTAAPWGAVWWKRRMPGGCGAPGETLAAFFSSSLRHESLPYRLFWQELCCLRSGWARWKISSAQTYAAQVSELLDLAQAYPARLLPVCRDYRRPLELKPAAEAPMQPSACRSRARTARPAPAPTTT